jgi:hypothetical protein
MPATNPAVDHQAAFAAWKSQVSKLIQQRFGLTLDDLPDMMTRDAFDSGTSPDEFFEEDVMQVMREDFGSLVDEI